jgi:peptidoglycan/xylan/chitin deacetylase (PgdA/CDA1 family)
MLTEAAALAAGGGLLAAYAVGCPASQLLGRTVFHGPRGSRRIALTFDDGPSDWTPAVLEVLGAHKVTATFFVCGRNAERRPELMQALAADGHEVGNHTYSHPCLLLHSARTAEDEIGRTQRIIGETAGVVPKWFRPPYGVRAPGLRRILPSLGLTSVLWTAIGNDWKCKADQIVARVLRKTKNGGIICLHDGDRADGIAERRETVAAVKRIVPELHSRGFEFVTVSRLLGHAAAA